MPLTSACLGRSWEWPCCSSHMKRACLRIMSALPCTKNFSLSHSDPGQTWYRDHAYSLLLAAAVHHSAVHNSSSGRCCCLKQLLPCISTMFEHACAAGAPCTCSSSSSLLAGGAAIAMLLPSSTSCGGWLGVTMCALVHVSTSLSCRPTAPVQTHLPLGSASVV